MEQPPRAPDPLLDDNGACFQRTGAFSMAESHVVAALISKRAELAGLIEHQQKEMGRLADDLAHLDATLRLFSPEIDLRTIRAKVHTGCGTAFSGQVNASAWFSTSSARRKARR
jgi:hypothetical protein